ncbi:MAG: exonuclease SbcCD subunit D [Ruminococcus sp.]|nr:exonuclease SbcCD subunit D [Ruminococcus sp.]
MKIMHLSDLHLGKRLNAFPLVKDQKYILGQIIDIADRKKPDCVVIAGDIYDRTVPSAEAVALFDDFLSRLSERELPVMVISGNHDSPERIAYGNKIMQKSRIYLSPVYDGNIKPVILHDDFGEVYFYLLPFIRPSNVRQAFKDTEINTYTDALKVAVDAMNIDKSKRNILVAHQFVTGAIRSESEEIYVGNLENVSMEVFEDFDYTALGHIHRPQNTGSDKIRYCGTPLKYSFSEADHEKSVTFVEIGEKNSPLKIETEKLVPLIDMQEIRGSFEEVMQLPPSDNYMRVTLTDEEMIVDAVGKLRVKFSNIMAVSYDNNRTNAVPDLNSPAKLSENTPEELFALFYREVNGMDMSQEKIDIVNDIIKEIWGYES